MLLRPELLFNWCVENAVPELAAYAEPNGSELVVVLHVVQFHISDIALGWIGVVEDPVGKLVDLISHHDTKVEWMKYVWRQVLVEWEHDHRHPDQDLTNQWWEVNSQPVLRESMVDSVREEVDRVRPFVPWKVRQPVVLTVKQKSVENVLQQSPTEDA